MSKNYVAIVVDRSGSMGGKEAWIIEGIREQLNVLSKVKKVRVSLFRFDGHIELMQDNVKLKNVEVPTEEDVMARGSTALYDAFGTAIKHLEPFDDGKNKFSVIVITDGGENASREFRSTIKSLITEKEAKDNWQIQYMGCDESAFQDLAEQTGISLDCMTAYSGESLTSRNSAARCCSEKSVDHFTKE